MAKASEVFGGVRQAEAWMDKPAMGLDGCRPIEMLQTLQGAEVVNDFLTRLEYGVYS
jgi:putative toxin-antitoxin system antitoxin component (TIGR02293 family)